VLKQDRLCRVSAVRRTLPSKSPEDFLLRIAALLASLIALASPAVVAAQPLRAAGPVAAGAQWQYSVMGHWIGHSGLAIADLDGDGVPEIAAIAFIDGESIWYVAGRDGAGIEQKWLGGVSASPFSGLAVAQMDDDSALEVLVAHDGQILVYDGSTRELERTIATPAQYAFAMAAADLDGDGRGDIILAGTGPDSDNLYIIDGRSGAVVFTQPGVSGRVIAVGQLDDDPALEIAVPTFPGGIVLDGRTHRVEWQQPEGWLQDEQRFAIGDLDDDGIAEILIADIGELRAYKMGQAAPLWVQPEPEVDVVTIGDVDGDGRAEIVYGDPQSGRLQVLDGATRTPKWMIANPEQGISSVSIADATGDGRPEIVWSGRSTNPNWAPEHLHAFDVPSRSELARSDNLTGPWMVGGNGDVDGDGRADVVLAVPRTDDATRGGRWFIRDASTGALEYASSPVADDATLTSITVADVDSSPRLEVLIAESRAGSASVVCIDAASGAEMWRSSPLPVTALYALTVGDVDGDGHLEVLATTGFADVTARNFVLALDAATGQERWRSGPLWPTSNGGDAAIRLGQLDGDPASEIAVRGSDDSLYVIDGRTRSANWVVGDAAAFDVSDVTGDGRDDLVVAALIGAIQILDPVSGRVLSDLGNKPGLMSALRAADVTGDRVRELVVGTRLNLSAMRPGVPGCPMWQVAGTSARPDLLVADIDGDDPTEIVATHGSSAVQVFEIGASRPQICVAPPTVAEGDQGVANLALVVALSRAFPTDADITFETGDIEAEAGIDYRQTEGTIHLPAGATTGTIAIPILGDTMSEADERFFLSITPPDGADAPQPRVEVTISDDDGARLSVTPTSIDFGTAVAGYGVGRTLTVKNVGRDRRLTGAAFATPLGVFSLQTSTYDLAPGESVALTVSAAPSRPGRTQGALVLTGGGGARVALSVTNPALVVQQAHAQQGSMLTVQVTDGPANPTDWVALYPLGAANGPGYVDWMYLNGLKTPPAAGLAAATLSFKMSQPLGAYEFRFQASKKYTRLATSPAVVITAAPTLSTITAPDPGSTLPGASATFTWTSIPTATQYWLSLGTTVGGTNIYDASQGLALSRTVGKLPTNGSTIYARLFTRTAGAGWKYTDTTYTAAVGASAVAAQMTSPTPGSRLPGSSVTFAWDAGSGVTQYWLSISKTLGGKELYDKTQGLNRSVTVTGLPKDGKTLYVRLFSKLPTGWASRDYTYLAAAP
jgi:hypothetical protein